MTPDTMWIIAIVIVAVCAFITGRASKQDDNPNQNLDLLSENQRLRTLNNDLDHQVRDLLKSRPISEQEYDAVARKMHAHDDLAQQQGYVVEYLRTAYPDDFCGMGGGHNTGLTFSQMVIGYLKRERENNQ